MLNTFAKRRLARHYAEHFQPLNEPEYAERDDGSHSCRGLNVMRMLCRRPDGRLMQVLGTIGASQSRLPREKGGGEPRNEYVIFVPAEWDLDREEHQWVLNLLGDLADYTCDVKKPLTYGHRVDMYSDASELLPEDVNMTGCALLEPLGGKCPELHSCRTGLLSRVSILHVMPITADELQLEGEKLQEQFYPKSGEVKFLCARKR